MDKIPNLYTLLFCTLVFISLQNRFLQVGLRDQGLHMFAFQCLLKYIARVQMHMWDMLILIGNGSDRQTEEGRDHLGWGECSGRD